jgi:hypothetical protein
MTRAADIEVRLGRAASDVARFWVHRKYVERFEVVGVTLNPVVHIF